MLRKMMLAALAVVAVGLSMPQAAQAAVTAAGAMAAVAGAMVAAGVMAVTGMAVASGPASRSGQVSPAPVTTAAITATVTPITADPYYYGTGYDDGGYGGCYVAGSAS